MVYCSNKNERPSLYNEYRSLEKDQYYSGLLIKSQLMGADYVIMSSNEVDRYFSRKEDS